MFNAPGHILTMTSHAFYNATPGFPSCVSSNNLFNVLVALERSSLIPAIYDTQITDFMHKPTLIFGSFSVASGSKTTIK